MSSVLHKTANQTSVQYRTNDPIIQEFQDVCAKIAETNPGDVKTLIAEFQELVILYYQDVRKQASRSFYAALITAGIGTGFFIYAIWITMLSNNLATISLIAGGLIQVISAINFYLYARTSRQFSLFHMCLERTGRFILANSLSENLSNEYKDRVQAKLIQIIANAPMITLDLANSNLQQSDLVFQQEKTGK